MILCQNSDGRTWLITADGGIDNGRSCWTWFIGDRAIIALSAFMPDCLVGEKAPFMVSWSPIYGWFTWQFIIARNHADDAWSMLLNRDNIEPICLSILDPIQHPS